MNVLHWDLLFVFLFSVTASSENNFATDSETDQIPELPRYVVFPGLDAESEEIAEWNVGFASPFNVFFGPKPYILGWVGEAGFGPGGEDEEDIEGEEGDLEGEEDEEEGEEGEEIEGEEIDEGDGEFDYEYEKLQN